MPNTLIDELHTQLTPELRALLDSVVARAAGQNFRAFLVGGTVRDLTLNRAALDVDITIEGDAIALAHAVAASTSAKLVKTSEFGTATLKSGASRVDLAAARAETYDKPGALPKIRPSTIDDDLLRRDFTINAIAIELTGSAPGKIVDPTGGVADLNAGLVRAIHDHSFQDDATRIIRAVRYATRFDFRIEESTLGLITRGLSYIDRISGTRLRQEMARVFKEERSDHALTQLRELGVLRRIHAALTPTDHQLTAFRSALADAAVAWALLAMNASGAEATDLVRRLALPRKQADAVRAMPFLRELTLLSEARPSEIAKALDPIPEGALAAYSLAGEPEPAHHIRDYLDRTRTVRPILRGDDIVELGVERGPDIADVLDHLRAARLDGEVTTREDEIRFVESYLARELVGF